MRYAPAIRVFLGFVWLVNGGLKLANPTFTHAGGQCEKWLRQFTAGTAGPYHDFVMRVVLPHVSVFAFLVEWGETLVGIALVLGLLARFASAASIFLLANYWVMRGAYATIGGYADIEPDLTALAAVILMWPATRRVSLDERLSAARVSTGPTRSVSP
jgi:thiosulfate dehydrogenase [quinone] large subunit